MTDGPSCRAPYRRLANEAHVSWTDLAHRPSWRPSPRLSRFILTGPVLRVPCLGRAGAAVHPGSAVSSGQPRTTIPQVNPPIGWQRNLLDLAYNDEVMVSERATTARLGDRRLWMN